ncbi:MAG: PLP-dependent aminotransferase family protein [Burkholderiaceae bacterium]
MLLDYLLNTLERDGTPARLPLNRQLYEALRRAILDGRLAAGDRLPSSRQLTDDLHVSRNTVVAALAQLAVEGYLSMHVGRGTFVRSDIVSPPAPQRGPAQPQDTALSARGRVLTTTHTADALEVQPFTPGIADFSAFPVAQWQRLQNKHWRMAYPDLLDYSAQGGHAPLRRALAHYLRFSRSLQVDAEQIIITSGTQQSMALCSQILADHGDRVWIEDPAYWGAVKAFQATGLVLHPVAADAQGMAPGPADDAYPPRIVYVTPSHQYPTGAVMPLARRRQILACARAHRAWVLEDDFDSEFRFDGPPLSSLGSLDPDARVLYLGTFSKVMYPGLKLGYLVVPPGLVDIFQRAHYDLNRPGQLPLQAALAEFMASGQFAKALRRARSGHAQRRRSLLAALAPCLGTRAHITGAEQGLHLCLQFNVAIDDVAVVRRIAALGLLVRPLQPIACDGGTCVAWSSAMAMLRSKTSSAMGRCWPMPSCRQWPSCRHTVPLPLVCRPICPAT